MYKLCFCRFNRRKNCWKIQRKDRDGNRRRNDNTKRSIAQERKVGTRTRRCFESQRCLLRSQYVLLCLQRNREKKVARCSRGCLRDWSGLIGWTLTGVEAGPPPLSPIQLLVIFAANPSVLWDLRIYPAAVKIGPPSASVERKVCRPSYPLRIRKPHWGIFRRVRYVRAISMLGNDLR